MKVIQIFHFNSLFSRMASRPDKLVSKLKPGELLLVSDWKRHLLAASENINRISLMLKGPSVQSWQVLEV